MKEYLYYVGDVLINSEIKSKAESEILLKMTKCEDEGVNERVLKILCKGFSKGCLTEGLFSLASIVLNADRDFTCANIEFDIKSFLIENHDTSKNEQLLEVETKKFALSFLKFEDSPLLLEVCKKLFIKKKNRNVLFYEKSAHDLFRSEVLDCPFLSYEIPTTPKIIICSMIQLIVNSEKPEDQSNYLRELYKTLQYYKILIPYCMRVPVKDQTFFEWLLEQHFPVGRGNSICFLTFLFVRNGLFLDRDTTFSDYLTAKVMKNFYERPDLQKSDWYKLALLYFLQIKNFNQRSLVPISNKGPQSLRTTFESLLDLETPITYALASESLYLIYKYQMIDSLSEKYRLTEQGEFTLEKQFINMNLFYTKRKQLQDSSAASRSRAPDTRLFLNMAEDLDDELLNDEDEGEALMTLRILRSLNRERNIVPTGLNTIFAPIQPPIIQPVQEQQRVVEQVPQEQQQERVEEKA